jgi:hypothetical protein
MATNFKFRLDPRQATNGEHPLWIPLRCWRIGAGTAS